MVLRVSIPGFELWPPPSFRNLTRRQENWVPPMASAPTLLRGFCFLSRRERKVESTTLQNRQTLFENRRAHKVVM